MLQIELNKPFLLCGLVFAIVPAHVLQADTEQAVNTTQATPAWSDRRGLPNVTWPASDDHLLSLSELNKLIEQGEDLFARQFNKTDGVGRPMATQAIVPTKRRRAARQEFSRTAGLDANSCAGCHNQPIVGGAGDFAANVFVSEGFQHADFDTTDPQFSNERNTNHLFGAGLVELLAREMTQDLHALRAHALQQAYDSGAPATLHLNSKGIGFGKLTAHPDGTLHTGDIDGVDADLVIRPFGHKGVMTSLRQFTVNALNHHHGMQATERFGARWTGTEDFDEDGKAIEVTPAHVSALVAWQASLPIPQQLSSQDSAWQAAAKRGSDLLDSTGCTACHKRALPLNSLVFADPGPLDAGGTLRPGEHDSSVDARYALDQLPWSQQLAINEKGQFMVPLFGDLKRHVIADRQIDTLGNELLSQRFVERRVFMTTELWGVGSTAPYGHRGDLPTLHDVIMAHGGNARASRDAYDALQASAQDDIVAFLKQLTIKAQP